MKRYQVGSAIFLLILGIYTCFEARKLEIGGISRPGPGFFPFWLGSALVVVSLALVIKLGREKVHQYLPSKGLWKGLDWEKILLSLVALLLYGFVLESLGYCIATFLLMSLLFGPIGAQKWWVAIAGSIITSFFSYLLFRLWLQIQLPIGVFGI